MDSMLLGRLYDCATSTRMGSVDCGFPAAMLRLAGLGYVEPRGSGYVTTKRGAAFLASSEARRDLVQEGWAS